MRASAPGKLVISGAYAVLRGAPALVTAVNRRVVADSERNVDFFSREVDEGLKLLGRDGRPWAPRPGYDASALRSGDEKIGLGSSAAICVSSLAVALAGKRGLTSTNEVDASFRDELFRLCRQAHKSAQGGGSGIDVAAAVYGGTLEAQKGTDADDIPTVSPVSLPAGLVFEVWACPEPASTANFVRRVFSAEETHPTPFADALGAQTKASEACVSAARRADPEALIQALRRQHDALLSLGKLSDTPIVLPKIHQLHADLDERSCLLPSGAGGGDISLYVGLQASSASFRLSAESAMMRKISLGLEAPGLTIEFDS